MNDERRLSRRAEPEGSTELEVVQRGFVLLRFDDVDGFFLDQPLRQKTGFPCVTLRWIDRLKEPPPFRWFVERRFVVARIPVLKGNSMDDESASLPFFDRLLGPCPRLADHMDGFTVFGQETCD